MTTRDPMRLFTTSQRVGADSQGFRKPRRDPGHLRYDRVHPACPQAVGQGLGREVFAAARAGGLQVMMRKKVKGRERHVLIGTDGRDARGPSPFSAS